MKQLTNAEEDVMQVIWRLGQAFVREILHELPEPKPAYNTVATLVKILEKKGFVSHEAFGKSYRYYSLVSEEAYKRATVESVLKKYFSSSYKELLSFFVKNEDLSLRDIEALTEQLRQEQERNQNDHD
jgi:BlaI family penicillinase repressor